MSNKESEDYSDFANVEKQQDYLIPESLPEGPYGSPIRKNAPVENKSTPWEEGQRYYSAFNYENKSLHQNLPRQMDGAHPTHDDPGKSEQPPYKNYQ
ncbi:MAG: cytosolic protein [Bacillota bacterium]|nr:cytosolic protein [Bacillota bacterium]MDP4170503.1 cytosolic protein [Bacillota bacterium]